MRRDVLVLNPNGYMVLRFKADNPGVWFFHCHIEWHIDQGLVATMIESPLELQKTLSIPQSHYDTCIEQDIPYAGNAAGNTVDLLDLKGANVAPGPLPAGFTARGIVALVFSVLAAFIGMAVITWYVFSTAKDVANITRYGLAEMGDADKAAEAQRRANEHNAQPEVSEGRTTGADL